MPTHKYSYAAQNTTKTIVQLLVGPQQEDKRAEMCFILSKGHMLTRTIPYTHRTAALANSGPHSARVVFKKYS